MPGIRALVFLAVLLTALALVPAGAHLLALPNKLAMGREAYLAAQGAYAGWALAGVLPIGAILACLALALRQQHAPASPWPALVAGGVLPELTWKQGVEVFGQEAAAELVYLVGLYCLVSVTLNGFDVPVPEQG